MGFHLCSEKVVFYIKLNSKITWKNSEQVYTMPTLKIGNK